MDRNDCRTHAIPGAAIHRTAISRSAIAAIGVWLAMLAGPQGALRMLVGALPLVAVPVVAVAREAPAAEAEETAPKRSRALSMAKAEDVERTAAEQYEQLKRQAAAQRALAPPDHPQLIRLRAISDRLIRQSERYNERAARWKWEVNLIGSRQVNAFCMPGGKIAVFVGLLDQLKLTDDEIAIVVGHEIAHALQEHGRERVGKMRLAQIGTVIASVGGALLGFGDLGGQVASGAAQLTLLKYGREDETEADAIGLDLAARGGFDPRAGLVVWEKMSAVAKGQPPQWLSSHPSHATRISEIARQLERVMPRYASAVGKPLAAVPPYQSNVGKPIPWPLKIATRSR
jgi:predicted Zn-dependent protease